jgi:hypothetical protein
MYGKVSVALAKCNVALVKCLSRFVAALACMLLWGFCLRPTAKLSAEGLESTF